MSKISSVVMMGLNRKESPGANERACRPYFLHYQLLRNSFPRPPNQLFVLIFFPQKWKIRNSHHKSLLMEWNYIFRHHSVAHSLSCHISLLTRPGEQWNKQTIVLFQAKHPSLLGAASTSPVNPRWERARVSQPKLINGNWKGWVFSIEKTFLFHFF